MSLTVIEDGDEITLVVTTPQRSNMIITQGYGPQGAAGPSGDVAVLAHIADETPHLVYDEGPSFVLLYENAKV